MYSPNKLTHFHLLYPPLFLPLSHHTPLVYWGGGEEALVKQLCTGVLLTPAPPTLPTPPSSV